MTVASAPVHRKPSLDRGLLRRERQARVGILRNTNAPPKPPTRRAALTGKWPSLRSSRRAAPGLIDTLLQRIGASAQRGDTHQPSEPAVSATPDVSPLAPVRTDTNGAVTGVDIRGLMQAVATRSAPGESTAARVPFAAEFRGVVEQAAQQQDARQGAAILRPETWQDVPPRQRTPAPDPARQAAPRARTGVTRRLRRSLGRALSRLGSAATVLLVALFLALLFLQLMSPVQI